MQDKWMNIGYENEDLKPYLEPIPDFNDASRLGKFALWVKSNNCNTLWTFTSIYQSEEEPTPHNKREKPNMYLNIYNYNQYFGL